jgi:DNA gyrase subunit B
MMSDNYTGDNISVLEDIEHVRERFGMYIGDNDVKGLHHLIWELVDNCVDEANNGHCDTIVVEVNDDGSVTVSDNGRGIPVDQHESGKNTVEVVMTKLRAGGKFDDESYQMSGGLHGVGVSVVNALSEFLSVKVHRDGMETVQKYEKGVPQTDVEKNDENYRETGTEINFKPDKEIFQDLDFQRDIIEERLEELSYLLPNVDFIFRDFREGDEPYECVFHSENGLVDYVNSLTNDPLLDDSFFMQSQHDDIKVNIAFNFEDDGHSQKILSYANNIRTENHGTHVKGFKNAITRAFKQVTGVDKFSGQDLREGVRAVIDIKIAEPQFEGQTKAKLGNKSAHTAVTKTFYDELHSYLSERPKLAEEVTDKAIKSAEARKAARKAREVARESDEKVTMSLSSKVADCTKRKTEDIELFLVEGDSAGGSAKQARSKKTQAILPLKGKIKNVERSKPSTFLKNDEIESIVTAIGAGIGDDFDLNDIRYGKVIIMTDPDDDGLHIQTLLLTLFFRYMPDLIDDGRVFVAKPPLYYRKSKDGMEYLYGKNHDVDKGDVRRFKGLGEMNPDELWSTTMNPENRRLIQISAENKSDTDNVVSTCMGRKVKPRKNMIKQKAKKEGWS